MMELKLEIGGSRLEAEHAADYVYKLAFFPEYAVTKKTFKRKYYLFGPWIVTYEVTESKNVN